MNINIVIVCYNSLISNSNALKSLILHENVQLIFVDNSTDECIKERNKIYCSSIRNTIYVDMNGNQGITKAYNKAISLIENDVHKWIIFFDQDTSIPKNYITELLKCISLILADVYFPVVKDKNGVLSPCLIRGKEFKRIENRKSNTNLNMYSFINSGMCVNRTVFNNILYDESLFLDFADHDFISSLKRNGYNMYLINNIVLKQDFSGSQKNSFEQDFTRFSIYIKDNLTYYRKWYNQIFYLGLLRRTIKLTFQHKSIVFFKLLFHKLSESK